MIITKSRAFRYVKFWKSVFPTLFKYRGDIAKTGDKLYIRCRFQSHTYIPVVKASTWKLIYLIFMKNKCAWHLFCEVRQREVPELCPFLKLLYPYRENVCLQFREASSVLVITIQLHTHDPCIEYMCISYTYENQHRGFEIELSLSKRRSLRQTF